MATPFEEFVNRELPRRSALLTLALTGWDDNPNLPGAPAILTGAPLGTWYHEDTADVYWRRYKSGWIIAGTGVGGGSSVETVTDLSIPIDYNDAGAVDPPIGAILTSQDVVNDVLSSLGATNFKHLERVWKALPTLLLHNITLNMASGVHRPAGDVADIAFDLTGKFAARDIEIVVQGASPSQYDALVATPGAPLSVDSYTNVDGNPLVGFTGTPFAGEDLEGCYVVFDTGQTAIIHQHDDSNLYVMESLSPTPTTAWVGTPSTVLRASDDDLKGVYSQSVVRADINGTRAASHMGPQMIFNDLTVQPWGSPAAQARVIAHGTGRYGWVRSMADDKTSGPILGDVDTGNIFNVFSSDTYLELNSSGYKGTGFNINSVLSVSHGSASLRSVLFTNSKAWGIFVQFAEFVYLFDCVLDKLGGGNYAAYGLGETLYMISTGYQFSALGGKRNEIRNPLTPGTGGIFFGENVYSIRAQFDIKCKFTNLEGPCVRLGYNCAVDVGSTWTSPIEGFQDGGGNLDVGIELSGHNASLSLNPQTNVTGANGDVRLKDGSIWSYSDIATYGPIVDGYGNRVLA